MIRLALERAAPAAVGPDRRGDTQRRTPVHEGPPLLHVQFDEAADPPQCLLVPPQGLGVHTCLEQDFGQRDAVGIGQPTGPVGGEGAGQQPAADAGDAEAGPFPR